MEAVVTQKSEGLPSPRHVAIIMDGNGRWARSRGLPKIEGHRQGTEAVRTAIEASIQTGVRYLTLYGFSSENWNRPRREVDDLMGLLRRYLRSEIAELHQNNIRLRVIGDRTQLSGDIVRLIEESEAQTAGNIKLDLILALSYGGRDEITAAARRLGEKVQSGELAPDGITGDEFAKCLETADIPDPDLLIRTSGEKRISNFLLWQLAYAEFVFLDALWPEFTAEHFTQALSEFGLRDRRFGASGT
ncbi:MAG: isoprenyl transferase [Rhodospirillales bacterium]|nr:isoprenyl transferase [Rhodospirillales bacterium]